MMISENTQLGLRFRNDTTKLGFLNCMREYFESELGITQEFIKGADLMINHGSASELTDLLIKERTEVEKRVDYIIGQADEVKTRQYVDVLMLHASMDDRYPNDIMDDSDSSHYLICESVYKAAELIRIGENFTGRTVKDIRFGKYTYLMGKYQMIRFNCVPGAIKGIYYDDLNKIAFDWGIEMEEGKYFFHKSFSNIFTTIMQVLTFVELGDIEIQILLAGRNNGGKKNIDKIHNGSRNNVYIVDSSWNKILIRTEGFAVRGHFRLQPCGKGLKDRKLIWIDAFEKEGYTRQPKARIEEEN